MPNEEAPSWFEEAMKEIKSDMNALKTEMNSFKGELKSEMQTMELQIQQVVNRPSGNNSFVEGLSTAAAIGGSPVYINPSYLR